MKKTICIILIVAFVALLGTSAYFIFDHFQEEKEQAQMYDSLAQIVEEPETEPIEPIPYSEGKSVLPELAALTSAIKKRYLPSHIILGDRFGLREPSMVMLEQLKTINQVDLVSYIGIIDDDKIIRRINNGLRKALGLWVYKPKNRGEIRCLCGRCLQDYKSNPDYIVKRYDPFTRIKQKCDKCDNTGFEYVVRDKAEKKLTK